VVYGSTSKEPGTDMVSIAAVTRSIPGLNGAGPPTAIFVLSASTVQSKIRKIYSNS